MFSKSNWKQSWKKAKKNEARTHTLHLELIKGNKDGINYR